MVGWTFKPVSCCVALVVVFVECHWQDHSFQDFSAYQSIAVNTIIPFGIVLAHVLVAGLIQLLVFLNHIARSEPHATVLVRGLGGCGIRAGPNIASLVA